ncbi:MAG: hypothetical protein ACJ0UT_03400 [Candidatus Latescibacterota bacterium]
MSNTAGGIDGLLIEPDERRRIDPTPRRLVATGAFRILTADPKRRLHNDI